jgi:ADP-ribosyl-[dinitrogen reductase] hydrolase
MTSDDTEHTCMVAESLLESNEDTDEFARQFARRLRTWLWCCPAGIGFATLRACLKLSCGVPPSRSGVHSAGNGPAMRAAILGAAIEHEQQLCNVVSASTRITHTDPRAEHGALAVALAARHAHTETSIDPLALIASLERCVPSDSFRDLRDLLHKAANSAMRGEATSQFAADIGLARGVTGYVNHTVPVALHAWWRHPHNFQAATESVIECGGDADSTAAIVGGIVGTSVGKEGIPREWLDRLRDWPRSVAWIEQLADQLSGSDAPPANAPLRLPVSALLIRNAFFASIIVTHALRRMLPPY